MGVSAEPSKRVDSVATEAIRRTWPMASTETVARLVRASSVVEKASGTLLARESAPPGSPWS
jgi:hypothetical protein